MCVVYFDNPSRISVKKAYVSCLSMSFSLLPSEYKNIALVALAPFLSVEGNIYNFPHTQSAFRGL